MLGALPACAVTLNFAPDPNVIVWPANGLWPLALFWTMYSLGHVTCASPDCIVIMPLPLGEAHAFVPPPEPPVPVPPDETGSILLMQTLKLPARSPPGICSCRSTGVPSPAPLVHVPAVTAQLGHVTSAKQTGPVQPFVNAGISVYGETAVAGGDGLWEKPIRTGLPPLLPVNVMLKHF